MPRRRFLFALGAAVVLFYLMRRANRRLGLVDSLDARRKALDEALSRK